MKLASPLSSLKNDIMANKKNNKKMKKGVNIMLILTILSTLTSFVMLAISIYMCNLSIPPTLTIHYNGKVVESGDSCNVIVCVDTTVAGACEQLFPVISNTTSRTAKDFAMTYTMTVDSVKIIPKQSYFNHFRENDSTSTLKYTETSMPPQTTIKEPLGMLKLIGNTGVLKSTAFATHEGAEKPYTFNSYAKFLYVDSKNLDSKQWKSACRHAIMTKEDIPFSPDYIKTDIFYCSLAHGMTFEFDKHLFYTKEVPNMAIADPDSIAFVDPRVEEVIVATLDTPMLSDTIGIISSSYKKNVWAGDSIEMTIANGYENDTTLYAVLQFQNLSTESIEVKYKPVVLKAGENELAFAIDNNQKFIDCTFINEHQYEEFLGGGDLSKKLLNNVITEKTARKIFPFIISVILFILSWELYKRSKKDKEETNDDNDSSEASNISNATISNVNSNDGKLEEVKDEEHEDSSDSLNNSNVTFYNVNSDGKYEKVKDEKTEDAEHEVYEEVPS